MEDFDERGLGGELDPAEFEEERRRLHARSSRSVPFVVAGLVAAVALAFWALTPRSPARVEAQAAAAAPAPVPAAPKAAHAPRHPVPRAHLSAPVTPKATAPAATATTAGVAPKPAAPIASVAQHSHKHPHRHHHKKKALPRLPHLPAPPPVD